MKMTITEALETIKGERWIACSEKYREAMNLITDTMHKYEKIEKIIEDWERDKGWALEMSELYWLDRVKEVIEDGQCEKCDICGKLYESPICNDIVRIHLGDRYVDLCDECYDKLCNFVKPTLPKNYSVERKGKGR